MDVLFFSSARTTIHCSSSWTVFPFFSVGDRCADLGKVSSHMVLLTVAHAVLFVFLNSSAVCVTFSPTASRVRIDRPITFS